MRRRAVTAFLLVAASGHPLVAGASDTPAAPARPATAVRARGPIAIDGRLDDEAWALATPIADLHQREPDEGQPATERTEVRFAYDDDALYVGARMFDPEPDKIVRRLSRRDAEVSSDLVRVFLDPHHDHQTGVMLTVSAAGSQGDAWLSNDFDRDESWDGVWDAAVTVDAEGWTAELRIPFSQLRFSPGDHQTWGLNVSRLIQRRHEEDWWALVPRNDERLTSAFGHLDGLDGIRPRRHLELLPYATTSVERLGTAQAGDPFNGTNRFAGGAGLDLKWGLTSSFTLDGTINPDFGQVEVDPAVVNLTAFETFFEEKRPFFLEGAQQFDNFGRGGLVLYGRFGARYPTLWYSRRIGRAPHLTADGDFVSQPAATTILGAAKLTGRTAGGWSMSLVNAVTDREQAHVATGGVRGATEVEPLTNYAAARVSREFGGRASVGLLATAVNRQLRTSELRDAVADGAYVGGADGHVFLNGKKTWVLSGSLAGSRATGDAAAIVALQRSSARYYQRPDATHVRLDPAATSLSGWTGQVNVNRTRGNLLVDGALWAISPGFESNDVGYSPEADRVGVHTGWLWQKTTPDRWSRDRSAVFIGRWLWNTAGDTLVNGYSVQGAVTFRNYWSLSGNADIDLPHLDDRATRGGALMRRPGGYYAGVYLSSDGRKPVEVGLGTAYSANAAGGWYAEVSPEVIVRPSPSLTVSVGPSFSRSRAVAQYVTAVTDPTAVATYGQRTVFSDLDRTEVSMVTRLNVIFTPRASLELYAQPLLSSGRYWSLKEFARPRTFEFARYGTDVGTIAYDGVAQAYTIDPDGAGPAAPFLVEAPDFNYRSLRVNAVFRWEWRLGSTLYAVWTQQREDVARIGEFRLRRDLRAMVGAPSDSVFMLKLAYWISR